MPGIPYKKGKKPMNKDTFACMLCRHPKPDWYGCYTLVSARNFIQTRWGYNLLRTDLASFNVLFKRFLDTGQIDLSKP
jgi:hypothetical protein